MNTLALTIFKLSGICPFNIKKKKIDFSQSYYKYSAAINVSLSLASMFRFLLYWNAPVKINSSRYIYETMTKLEPFLEMTQVALWGVLLFRRHSLKHLKKYFRLLHERSTERANRLFIIANALNVCQLLVLSKLACNVLYLVPFLRKLDGFVSIPQTTFRSWHLLQMYVTMFIINSNLKVLVKELMTKDSDWTYKNLIKILDLYAVFVKLFTPLLKLCIFHLFYELLQSMKRLEDAFLDPEDVYFRNFDGIIVFWNLFHLPVIFVIIHEGEVYQKMVNFYFYLTT